MIGTLCRIIRDFGYSTVHKPVTNRVEHRLMFGHRIDDAFRVFRATEGQVVCGKPGQIRPVIHSAQAMQRIVAVMNGP